MAQRKKARSAPTQAAPRAAPSTELEALVGYNLRRAQSRQMQRFRSVFGPYKIRPVQLSILIVLFNNPKLKQTDLGKALAIKRANVVTLLDELEERKLLVRKRDQADRRSHFLELTESGKKTAAKLIELHAELEKDLAEQLGEKKRDQLLALLRAFRDVDAAPEVG